MLPAGGRLIIQVPSGYGDWHYVIDCLIEAIVRLRSCLLSHVSGNHPGFCFVSMDARITRTSMMDTLGRITFARARTAKGA
jgi:hypothetical protein